MSMQPQPNVRLKTAREARGWAKTRVAQFLEISASTYDRWEDGIRPGERNLNKLCHLFRKSREEIGF